MQIFLEKPKKVFAYEVDGVEHTTTSTEYLNALGVEPEEQEAIQRAYRKFMNRLPYFERQWRNRRLDETDWMLIPDATYGGEALAGSEKLAEVIAYRQALRDYNLTTDDRPTKPEWL